MVDNDFGNVSYLKEELGSGWGLGVKEVMMASATWHRSPSSGSWGGWLWSSSWLCMGASTIYSLSRKGCKLVITFTGTLELMNNNDIISTFTSLEFHKRSRYGLSVDLRMLNHLWSFLLPWSLIPIITHRCSLYIVSVAGWESTAFQPNLLSFWQLMQLNVPFLQQILSFDCPRKDDDKQLVEICSDGN